MNKYKNFNRTIIFMLIFTMSLFLFIGCGNRNTSDLKNSTENLAEKQLDGNEIKKKYEAGLQQLVDDATITKDQANKVLNSIVINASDLGKQTEQKQKDNLNKLVEDKVITREQADRIIEVIDKIDQ